MQMIIFISGVPGNFAIVKVKKIAKKKSDKID